MEKKNKKNKSLMKRLKITGKKKLLRRPTHQNHFKAKYPGRISRTKHRVQPIAEVDAKKIKKMLPYL